MDETMTHLYIPSWEDRLGFMSAESAIPAIGQRIRTYKEAMPDGMELIVTMKTPDGDIMDVLSIEALGFSAFRAEGHVNGMPAEIVAHISTLSFFCRYSAVTGKGRGKGFGFTSALPERAHTTDTQETPEQTTPDKP